MKIEVDNSRFVFGGREVARYFALVEKNTCVYE